MSHVDGIEGALLLVHGLIDENVHFRHTARLVQVHERAPTFSRAYSRLYLSKLLNHRMLMWQALVEAQKSYELLTFPKERHSPRALKDRTFMEQQLFGFLRRWLG
jgi:dipeptidyl-peptidase-4